MPAVYSSQRILLSLLGLTGTAIFSFFFLLTFITPTWVEQYASDFIEQEAAKQVDTTIDQFQPPTGDSALSQLAARLYKDNEETIELHRERLRTQAHERMADAIAEIRNLDCECRAKWAEQLKTSSINTIEILQQRNSGLTDIIHASYTRVVDNLKTDIRIFTAANALVFLLILGVLLGKPQAVLQLFVPSVLAGIATIICSYFYIFEQNWLLTIIYNDYLGWGYLAYLGVVFGFLCDIVLNKARVTTEIINGVLQGIGSSLSAVPC